MKKIATFFAMPFLILPIILFYRNRQRIEEDMNRYSKEVPFPMGVRYLCYCLVGKKEFRSVFAYRFCKNQFIEKIVMLFVPPLETIEILTPNIGKGMRLFHKSGCTINACSIGEQFSCGQGVTIGIGRRNPQTGETRPTIGNAVWIGANVVAVGGITIGDHATVGAGSVVVHDVPQGATVVGNPARVIKEE